jgi:hypothetical protein
MRNVLVLLIVIGSAACARRTDLMDYRATSGIDIDAPAPGRAVVVFVRPDGRAKFISSTIFDDLAPVAVLMQKTYAVYQTSPGKHRFMVVSEAADFMDADLEEGKVYFAWVADRMGAWRARFSLLPVTPHDKKWKDLREWMSDSDAHRVALNAAGETWAQDNAPSIREKHDAYLPKWLAKNERPNLYAEDGIRLQDFH